MKLIQFEQFGPAAWSEGMHASAYMATVPGLSMDCMAPIGFTGKTVEVDLGQI